MQQAESGVQQNAPQANQRDVVPAASTVNGDSTVSINKSIAYENLVLGHASSRGVPLKSENEEKLWSTLETRLYGDPNRQQAMPGIYVPHRNFVLVNAPAAAEDEEEKETEAPEPISTSPVPAFVHEE